MLLTETPAAGGAAVSFPPHAATRIAARNTATGGILETRMRILLGGAVLRQVKRLAWKDEVGVLDDVSIGLVNLMPFVRAAVFPLGDLREAVAADDDVGPRRRGRRRLIAGRRG